MAVLRAMGASLPTAICHEACSHNHFSIEDVVACSNCTIPQEALLGAQIGPVIPDTARSSHEKRTPLGPPAGSRDPEMQFLTPSVALTPREAISAVARQSHIDSEPDTFKAENGDPPILDPSRWSEMAATLQAAMKAAEEDIAMSGLSALRLVPPPARDEEPRLEEYFTCPSDAQARSRKLYMCKCITYGPSREAQIEGDARAEPTPGSGQNTMLQRDDISSCRLLKLPT